MTVVIDLLKRAEKGTPLSATDHDNNLTAIEDAITDLAKGNVGAYSLEWNRDLNTFTRLDKAEGLSSGADFNSIEPWASIQRCNMQNNGTVTDYHGDVNFAYDGSNGQVMVEIPAFYYRTVRTETGAIFSISPTPMSGFKLHPAFVRNEKYLEHIYPSAFEGYYNSGLMDSIANVVPSTSSAVSDEGKTPISAYPNATIAGCRGYAQARGAVWEQYDFLTHNAISYLAFIEYATFDLQTAIGKGVTEKSEGAENNAEKTGQTAGYDGGFDLGNNSGQVGTNGLNSMSYRGVENLYGNIHKWCDGLNILDNEPYVADHGFASDTFAPPYKSLQIKLPSSNGYGGDIVINDVFDASFLTSALGGSSGSGLFDYYYQSPGARVAVVGGHWNLAGTAGTLCWFLNRSSSDAARTVGARSQAIITN